MAEENYLKEITIPPSKVVKIDWDKSLAPLPKPPKGFEPFVERAGDTGRAAVQMDVEGAQERDLLEAAGFDANEFCINGAVSYRKWMRYDQEWLHYYRFDVIRRAHETRAEAKADIEELQRLFTRKPPKPVKVTSGDDVFVVVFSDWQIGKNSQHTINGVRRALLSAKQRLLDLRKQGRTLSTVVLASTGDIVENCDGHYSQQTHVVDLDMRGQMRVGRRLHAEAISLFAPLCERLVVTGVGGNHGEVRKEGKSFTTFADNYDLVILDNMHEVFTDRPGFEHVEFFIPDDQLSTCLDLGGVPVGFTHGHLASKGGTLPQAKQQEWWKNQFWSDTPASKAQILITSHFHHLTISNWGERTHIQTPAFDGGSPWFTQTSGMNSPDGLLTFIVDPFHPLGWDDLKVV